jgi:3-hydroxyisobutyrate dehydrogenase-like beta-hydroxyacid dehydrogenase
MKQENVTVIGVGSMGSVLVNLLIRKGYKVTIWNRTKEKANALIEKGALMAEDVLTAITASEVIIVCVSNYESAHQVMRKKEVEQALRNKILIQLSTGTPQEATDEETWAKSNNIRLLDGAIMVTPTQMGTPESVIIIAGENKAYQQVQSILKVLAEQTIYTGEKANTASAMDIAMLSYFFNALIGFAHAARVCEAEGIDIKELGTMIWNWSPGVGNMMLKCAERIAGNYFEEAEGSLQTCYMGLELISRHAREANMSAEVPAFATSLFKKGMDQGLALEDGSAIFKVLV